MPESRVLYRAPNAPASALAAACWEVPVDLCGAEVEALVGRTALLSLMRTREGHTLIGCDIHTFARDAGIIESDLVLHLPRSVDGVPLVRISAEAFRPWLSYGVRLAALVVPGSVREIAPGALAPLCAEAIALPAGLQSVGPDDVDAAATTKRARARRFVVQEGNARYAAADGSLYELGGEDTAACKTAMPRTLAFAAFPYPNTFTVAAGTREIRRGAFARNVSLPHAIACPDSLERTNDLLDGDALWVCEPHSAFAAFCRVNGLYAVSPQYFEEGRFVFDAAGEDACTLVKVRPTEDAPERAAKAGNTLNHTATYAAAPAAARFAGTANTNTAPAESERHLAIPATVRERCVVRIGRAALPEQAAALDVPEGVTHIEDDNRCARLERLTLPGSLKSIGRNCFASPSPAAKVRIPRNVEAIGAGSFANGIVAFDALHCTVHIPAKAPADLFAPSTATLESGESVQVPFNVTLYDNLLAESRLFPNRCTAIASRLAGEPHVGAAALAAWCDQLAKGSDPALRAVAEAANVRAVKRLAAAGFYERANLQRQCELLRQAHKPDCVAALMSACAPKPQTAASRFAL